MNNAMDQDRAKTWFGATPPDLTLVARARQPDWLYTYLRTFYRDDSRPYGVNNLVFPNVGMPHVLLRSAGPDECVAEGSEPMAGTAMTATACELAEAGSMDAETFDQTVYDLVNFLAYVAEPVKADRQRIGIYALLFIAPYSSCSRCC
jgi:ubiquinol-cytochrome c reductase cytochrome b subunit